MDRPIDLSTRLDPAGFKKLYPEFEHAPVEIIDRTLVDATASLHPSVFGGRYAEAIGLFVADVLGTQIFGQNARLDPAAPQLTTYGKRLATLKSICASGLGRVARRI